jgi:hypothetical protein
MFVGVTSVFAFVTRPNIHTQIKALSIVIGFRFIYCVIFKHKGAPEKEPERRKSRWPR